MSALCANGERVTWKGCANVLLQRLFPMANISGDKGLDVGTPMEHGVKEFE